MLVNTEICMFRNTVVSIQSLTFWPDLMFTMRSDFVKIENFQFIWYPGKASSKNIDNFHVAISLSGAVEARHFSTLADTNDKNNQYHKTLKLLTKVHMPS